MMESISDEYDFVAKIIIIGDSGVGKSNILSRFVFDYFDPIKKSTLGFDYGRKIVTQNGNRICVQVWDTAGTEKYRAVTGHFYHLAAGALIVYDISDKSTFENVSKWHEECRKFVTDIPIILIGNKADLEPIRKVGAHEGKEFAIESNFGFFETSAKSNVNIHKAFRQLLNQIPGNKAEKAKRFVLVITAKSDKRR